MNERLFNATEVAEQLCIAEKTVRHWTIQKKIQCVKLSKRCVRYTQAQIDAVIAKYTVMPEVKEPSETEGQ